LDSDTTYVIVIALQIRVTKFYLETLEIQNINPLNANVEYTLHEGHL